MSENAVVAIIWLLRENEPMTTDDLVKLALTEHEDVSLPDAVRQIGIEYQRAKRDRRKYGNPGTIEASVRTSVKLLQSMGIFQLEGENGEITLNRLVTNMLRIMNISLTDLVAQNGQFQILYPIFAGALNDRDDWADIFVAMPFRDYLDHVYNDHVRLVAEEIGLTCKRGDDFSTTHTIMKEVWSSIVYAKICIFDCTGKNANVFYELGIAHTIGVKTILIAQSEDDIPFDIRHMRYIIYENNDDGLQNLRRSLKETIESELNL